VVVIDDHDLNRELLRTLLERKGYRALLAEGANAGIKLVLSENPSIVLLDLAMPEKDGFAALRELRAHPELRRTPVVAVTALAMRGDEARAAEAGFDAYLTKPIDRGALYETIERLLKREAPP
jgi:CheY-like chemotaxis protein